jgi:hypothetical protein
MSEEKQYRVVHDFEASPDRIHPHQYTEGEVYASPSKLLPTDLAEAGVEDGRLRPETKQTLTEPPQETKEPGRKRGNTQK